MEHSTQISSGTELCTLQALERKQDFLLSNLLAHNLTRQLKMRYDGRLRKTGVKRPALWQFSKITTLRKQRIQRAGRLVKPQGVLTLSVSANTAVEDLMHKYLLEGAVH